MFKNWIESNKIKYYNQIFFDQGFNGVRNRKGSNNNLLGWYIINHQEDGIKDGEIILYTSKNIKKMPS